MIIGAILLNKFPTLGGLAAALVPWVEGLGAGPFATMAVMLLIYPLLGCALDAPAMILLTIPIFFPVAQRLESGLVRRRHGGRASRRRWA